MIDHHLNDSSGQLFRAMRPHHLWRLSRERSLDISKASSAFAEPSATLHPFLFGLGLLLDVPAFYPLRAAQKLLQELRLLVLFSAQR